MKRDCIKRILPLLLVLMLITSLLSCSMDESRFHLSGGELLNEEKMSELESKVLAEETADDETDEDSEDASFTVVLTETPSEEESQTEDPGIVYWTKSGSVWHVSIECSSLKKSPEILSGTVEEALDAGKERVCSRCAN